MRRLAFIPWLFLLLALLAPPGRAAEGTSFQDCLDRAVQVWTQEVLDGRGSAGALDECRAGRFDEAVQQARHDRDFLGAALLEATRLMEQESGMGPGLVGVAETLDSRVEPLLLAWLRYYAGLDLASSGAVQESCVQFGRAVELFRDGGDPQDLGQALKQLGGSLLLAGQASRAEQAYAEAARLAESQGRSIEQALLVGMRARALADLGRLTEAAQLYRSSLPVLEEAGEDVRAYAGHSDLGTVLMRQGRYADAQREMDAAERYFDEAGPPEMALNCRLNRAGLDLERGRYAEAASTLRACLAGPLEPEQSSVARSNLARVLVQQGHYAEAESMLVRLADDNQARGARTAALGARSALGALYRQQKRLVEAEEAWARCLEGWKELGSPLGEAGELTNLGNLRLNQGRPGEAEDLFRQALAVYEGLGAQASVASTRQNLSGALMARGRYQAALEALARAREDFQRLDQRSGLAATLFKTALLKLWLGERREAVRLLDGAEEIYREGGMERALLDMERVRAWLEADQDPEAAHARLYRVVRRLELLGIPLEAASVRAELSGLALARGDSREAGSLARQALAAWKDQDLPLDRLGATMNLAWAQASEGQLDRAGAQLRAVWEESQRRGLLVSQALAAGTLARVELLAGRLKSAEQAAQGAEAAGSTLQRETFEAGGERAATASTYPFHSTAARIQLALGRPDRALEALERGRGRLLDVARLRTLQAATTPEARSLVRQLQAAQVAVLRARHRLSQAPADRAAQEELDRTTAERDRLEVDLTRLTRTWEQLRDPSAPEVRRALPEGTVLLEYAFLDDGLHVFVATREEVWDHLLLPSPAPTRPAEDFLDSRLEARTAQCCRQVGVDRLVAQILQGSPQVADLEARRLWDLLMAPLEPRLRGAEALLVVPDRDLHFLPFEALKDPQGRRLLERYSVTYLNTARELFVPAASGRGEALVVGGPVYSLPGRPAEGGVELRRLGGPWSELAGARQEAEEVAGLEGVPARLGLSATEAYLKGRAPGSSALHLATHGFVGAPVQAPGVSRLLARRPQDVLGDCGLVLAGANTGGDGQEDGILTAFEVLGMDLGETALVVLSACDTGRGEVNAHEGVFGLKRSFLAAGARQVVYSMWPVSDQGTRALMARFYHHLGRGVPTSRALRAARLELLRGDPVLLEEGLAEEPEQFQDPFYWAPFALVGRPDR